MRAILDTNVLIAGGLDSIDAELAISVVSLAELQFGVLAATDPVERARRLQVLSGVERRFDPIPVDVDVASSYALLCAAVSAAGRQPRARSLDLLIAATAHARRAALVTYNTADFVDLDGIVDVIPAA